MVARMESVVDSYGEHGPPGKKWVAVSVEYNPEFLEDLKANVRSHERKWHKSDKSWWVDPRVSEIVASLLEEHCYDVHWVTPKPVAPSMCTDSDILQILPTACHEVARAAYRALCTMHHPDKGGSTEKMQQINAAWDRFQRKFKA